MNRKFKVGILSVFFTLIFIFCLVIGRTAIGNLAGGKVHFPDEYIGDVIKLKDGHNFKIFRRLQVDGNHDNPEKLTVFQVRFKFRNLSNSANKRLSIMPAPFLMGMEGFREKIWAINESTNEFQGIYQWSTKKTAENYPESFIFKLMTKRAAPGTVSYEIMPDTDMLDYLSSVRVN